jgi:DNA-binding NarL/FixJ family response regulator
MIGKMTDPIRILVVDDFQIMRKTLELMLKAAGNFEVVGTAENGIEAFNQTKLKHVDLVLMDLEMPFMDGIQATKTILKSNPKTRILAITYHDDIKLLTKIIAAGSHGYLIKPVTMDRLKEAINAVMSGKYYLGFKTNMSKPDFATTE